MKLSEAISLLENGKTIFHYAGGLKTSYKMIEVAGVKVICRWMADDPERTLAFQFEEIKFPLNEKFEVQK